MVFTWSENPYEDMWNHLMFLSKRNNAKNLLAGKIRSARAMIYDEGKELEKKATQVAFGISQSFEYFQAAHSVSVATSPLLYFYGMLSLAKSLIVANEKDVYLEDVRYHGLAKLPRDKTLENYESDPESWNVESEYAIARDGVFPHFTKVISNFEYPNKAIFTFKDVLAVCPETSQMFERYYAEPSKILYLYSFKQVSKDPFKIQICPRETDEKEIFERVPELSEDFDLRPDIVHNQARILNSRNLKAFPEYMGIYESVRGGRFIVGGLRYRLGPDSHARYVNPSVVDYIALYILSHCVRYKQDLWGTVIQGRESGVLGLIGLFLSIAIRRFPNTVLNSFFGEKFSYGAPGYFV